MPAPSGPTSIGISTESTAGRSGELRPLDRPLFVTRRLSARVEHPLPAVLVVSLAGVLDEDTAPVLTEHLHDTPAAVLHVVLDLHAATPLDPSGIRALLDLDRRATHRGYVLHIAGTAPHAVLDRLFRARLLRT